MRGDINDYCRVAVRHLKHGGLFACVFPEEQCERLESAARATELTIIRRRPVVFKEGEPPLISLFAMQPSEDLPKWFRGQTWVEPSLIIRTRAGDVHPEYQALKLAIGFPP